MSDSVRPRRRQPTRLPRPWDSPGKNTGVGCHFLLQCMKVKVKSLSHVRLFSTPWTAVYQAPPPMRFSRQEYWSGVPSPSPTFLLALVTVFLVITNLVGMKWYLLEAVFPLVNNKHLAGFLAASQMALPTSAGDAPSVPGLGRSAGEGNSDPLQYSCPENPMDRGAWLAVVSRVAKSHTQLKQLSMHALLYLVFVLPSLFR